MIREILYIFFDFTDDEFLMFLTPTYDTERSQYCSVFFVLKISCPGRHFEYYKNELKRHVKSLKNKLAKFCFGIQK